MNRTEKDLVGVFLKHIIRKICRTFPYDEAIRWGPYPYSEKQMKARRGASFLLQHVSGYENVGVFMMRFDRLVRPLGNVSGNLPSGGEMLVDSADLPALIGGYGSLPDDTLCKLFSGYFSSMYQDENWPHIEGCYEELMQAAANAGYVEFRKLDAATVKEWTETGKEAYGACLGPAKIVAPDQVRALMSKWEYENEKEMYDLFDREHGTTDGKIWMWSSKMNRLLDNYSMHVDPTFTGGPWS